MTQLADVMTVEIGSPAMDDLRFALLVLSLHAEDRLGELDDCWDSDTDEATGRAIRTLLKLTSDDS